MAATYTAGSTADRDRLRLLIGDFPPAGGTTFASDEDAKFQDAELDDMVTQEGNVTLAGALAFEILAGRAADEFDFTADGATFRSGQKAANYMSRARQLRARGTTATIVMPQRKDGYSDDIPGDQAGLAGSSTFDRPDLSTGP